MSLRPALKGTALVTGKSASSRAIAPKTTTYYSHPPQDGISRELIKAIAMQIGKDIVAYVEVMYPEAIKATSSTFTLSLRNSIHNKIVSIADLHDEAAIRKRLADNETHRKQWVGAYRKMRRKKCEHGIREHECGLCDDARRVK